VKPSAEDDAASDGESFRIGEGSPVRVGSERRPSPMSRPTPSASRAEIQGLPICRRSGNAEWRRNSDHSSDPEILLRRGEAKASGADSEAWSKPSAKPSAKPGKALRKRCPNPRASERRSESQPERGGERESIESRTAPSGQAALGERARPRSAVVASPRADVGKAADAMRYMGEDEADCAPIRWIM